ncbi:MAG: ribonucleoside-diphosphate reductase alpha chain, partial [Rhodothermales bacterium]
MLQMRLQPGDALRGALDSSASRKRRETKTGAERTVNPTAQITPGKPTSNPNPLTGKHAAILDAVNPPAGLEEPMLTKNAITVLERRYLKKNPETGETIETPRQLMWRVAAHVAKAETMYAPDHPDRAVSVAEEFYGIMARREFLPNSPCLMNAGREMGMLSACFVIPVEDSIEGIFE